MITDLPIIQDPLSNRQWIGFPDGRMLPADAVMDYIRDTYQFLPEDQLIGAARLVGNIADQKQQILNTENERKRDK